MTIFLQASFEGVALGAVYSLVAIGFVLIYKATVTIFAPIIFFDYTWPDTIT